MFLFCERIFFLIKHEEMHFMKFIRCFGQEISIRFQIHARLPTSIFEFASKIRFPSSASKLDFQLRL